MARHKEFNQEIALDKAVEIFWEKGYEATSMQDLVNGMGIGRGSLYDTFGSKRTLYYKALDRYRSSVASKTFTGVFQAASNDPVEKMRSVFSNVIDEAMGDYGPWGCFLVNTGVELSASDADAKESGKRMIAFLEKLFDDLLNEAKKSEQLSSTAKTKPIARKFANTFLGIRVLAKMETEKQFMVDVVDSLFEIFE